MDSNTKTIKDGIIELSVELTGQELADYVKEAEGELSQNISIDGFRPGKAPKELIKDQLDKQQILQLAFQEAIEESLARIIVQKELDVVKSADLKIEENTKDKLKYHVTLSVFPKINLPELSKFKAEKKPVNVEEKEINEALETIRQLRSKIEPKTASAQTGDRVEVDFQVSLDGKAVPGGESKNHPLIIGGKNFIPGFEENLVGLKKDEEKKFSLVAPGDYYQKELAGKKLDFAVKVNQVQKVSLPDLNDDFAKTLGNFKNLGELRNNVQEGIVEEKKQKEKQRVCLDVLNQMIEATEIKAPEFLVQDNLENMIHGFDQDLHAKGLELGMYLARLGKTQDDLRKDWQKDAEKQAKIFLVLHTIAKQNKITADPQELDEAVNQTAQALISRGQILPNDLNLPDLKREIEDKIVSDKTLDLIVRTCTV